MAINAYGNYATTYTDPGAAAATAEDKTALGKDDFMKLLLIELQYQDPTEPMDSEKILTQTSQLANLEASENTNKALENLAASLTSNMQFSTIAAIGKMADTGSNAVVIEENGDASFDLYFQDAVKYGTVQILDVNGNVVDTMPLESSESGIQTLTWDGREASGEQAEAGYYYITADYTDPDGGTHTTRVGTYPIESVLFENGEALVKLGSTYVPFDSIKEISEG
jgi:flagellar basal-body rod modification protein FlgD